MAGQLTSIDLNSALRRLYYAQLCNAWLRDTTSVMMNPFEFGRELGTDELVDRRDEVDAVIQTLRQGSKLFLVGPRRFGKHPF